MPVEFTKALSPEMQRVSDCRESVKQAEATVEDLKEKLKAAKAVWETTVTELNEAIDAAIDAERQPTLFSGIGDDLADEMREPRTVQTETVGDGSGVDGRTDRIPAGQVAGVPELYALPAHEAGERDAGDGPGGEADDQGDQDDEPAKPRKGRRAKKGA